MRGGGVTDTALVDDVLCGGAPFVMLPCASGLRFGVWAGILVGARSEAQVRGLSVVGWGVVSQRVDVWRCGVVSRRAEEWWCSGLWSTDRDLG